MEKITVDWLDENKSTILCTYNQEGWNWEDFFQALKQQSALIDTVDCPKVDVIVDVTRSTWMPKAGSLLSGMRKFSTDHNPRQGHTIIVGARGMVAAIARSVMGLIGPARQEMHFSESMDEARLMVQEFEAARRLETEKAS